MPRNIGQATDVSENEIVQIKDESAGSCIVSSFCSDRSDQDRLNLGSINFSSPDISSIDRTGALSLSKDSSKEELIEEERKNEVSLSENLSDRVLALQDEVKEKIVAQDFFTGQSTTPQQDPDHTDELLDTKNNQSKNDEVISFSLSCSPESNDYLNSSDSSSSGDTSSSSSDESEGSSISKEEELLRKKLLLKRQNLLESRELINGNRDSSPVSSVVKINELDHFITKDYVDEILSSIAPAVVNQSNISLNIPDNDIDENSLPSAHAASINDEAVVSNELLSKHPQDISGIIPQDKDISGVHISKIICPKICDPSPSLKTDLSVDVQNEKNQSSGAQSTKSVIVLNKNVNSLKQDLTKDIEKEFTKRK